MEHQGIDESIFREALDVLHRRMPDLGGFIESQIPPRFRATVTADDVIQDVWVSLLRTDLAAVRDWEVWLKLSVRTALIAAFRRARAYKRGGSSNGDSATRIRVPLSKVISDLEGQVRTPSRELSQRESDRAVVIALAALPDEARNAIRLVYFEGRSRQDAARILGKSASALHGLLYRGLQRLRELLGDAIRFVSDG